MSDSGARPPEPPDRDSDFGARPPDRPGRSSDAEATAPAPPPGPESHLPDQAPSRQVPQVELWSPSWPKWIRRFVGVAAVVAPILFFASWSFAEPSRDFCGSCHTVEAAAAASAESIHAEVPCLACHHRPGLLGSITYYPTLLRETVHEATGLPIARNVLEPKPCETCHQDVAESEGHRDLEPGCLECHREVAHRYVADAANGGPHPPDYYMLHGRDSVSPSATCFECHETDFCQTCHVQAPYPHPETWIPDHGAVAVERGVTTCDSCHQSTFCGGCHGTDVPHSDGWLGQHNQADLNSIQACTTCHARAECEDCHARHQVHREQILYDLELTP